MSSTCDIFDPFFRKSFRSRKATSMHFNLQQVEVTSRLRPIGPCWTSTPVLHQIPIQGKRNPPALFAHRSHPRTVQAIAAICGKPVPSRIGARGAGRWCTSKADSQRPSASFFPPVARSNLTCCSKSVLAAACKMGFLVWTARHCFQKSGEKSYTYGG